MKPVNRNENIQLLRPTHVLRKKVDLHEQVKSELVNLFYEHRRNDNKAGGSVYSSSVELLMRYDNPALNR